MKNSWHLGKLAGIDVKLHWTFLLIPVWILLSTLLSGGSVAVAAAYTTLVLAVFGCVVLHELGHALAARKFGIQTSDIVLLPIGGVANLERIPRVPSQELLIALAGPAVNVVIAALLFAWMAIAPINGIFGWFVFNIALINIGLVLFNMLPAFPMDGGRVLRSTLAMVLSYRKATQIATLVGKLAAIGFGFWGLFSGQLILMLVAGFVFIAASAEAARNQLDFLASEQGDLIYTSDVATRSKPNSLPRICAEWNVGSALGWLSRNTSERFSVVKNGSIIGFATVHDLQLAAATGKSMWPVEKLLLVQFVG